jgi:DNA-binding response OmpR family regulator
MTEASAATTSKLRVLIADTLAIILNQAGFEARAVYSGEDAISALEGFRPDMLISDVIMTGKTGIETAIATRAKMPQCKVLLFSGQAATADLLEKARLEGHEFEILAKPVHPTDLLAKLRG